MLLKEYVKKCLYACIENGAENLDLDVGIGYDVNGDIITDANAKDRLKISIPIFGEGEEDEN